jgi:hypothetical protein
MFPRFTHVALLLAMFGPSLVHGSKRFLADGAKYHHAQINSTAFRDDIVSAMDFMLGCGGQVASQKAHTIQKILAPMWRTLPKTTDHEHIDRRSLRYLVHRYFMKTSSLMIRGFEPSRLVNESHWGVADILSQMVPAFVESVLEAPHAKNIGFSITDAVHMVVMLEQLLFDSESTLLGKVYQDQHKPMQRSLSYSGLKQVLEQYLVEWLVDGDEDDMKMLAANRTLTQEVVPHFEELVKFMEGRINTLLYTRWQGVSKNGGKDLWASKFSFADAHEIVGDITRSFASYWQSECDVMKLSLVAMDTHNTGRVPLSKFYNQAISTDWRFGESEAYLRELGALDESSTQIGPQVIIPNYIQATSNCIVSTSHYLVCCASECESLMGDIELTIGAPMAFPEELIAVVGNMTAETTVDDDDFPMLEGALADQLDQIAEKHGGKVPLHGRLFAQWLHYVFPRECPFPHRIGMVSAVTPAQYGDEYIATSSDMRKLASNATASDIPIAVAKEELEWMSQWSPEEEFMVDYSSEFGMSLQRRLLLLAAAILFLTFGLTGGIIGCSSSNNIKKSDRKKHALLV